MKKYRTATLAVAAPLSVSLLASRVVGAAMAGVMMKDGKATGPMDHEMR